MKKCTKCGKNKSEEEFNFKIKQQNLRQHQCKDCTRKFIREHYYANKAYYLNKAKKRNAKLRDRIQEYIRNYLDEHPCIDCGETDLVVLEFDHRNRLDKVKTVSQLVRSQRPLGQIIDEINKCDVRCANCHRRKTAKQFKWYKINNAPVA